jgi:hypothetical protein
LGVTPTTISEKNQLTKQSRGRAIRSIFLFVPHKKDAAAITHANKLSALKRYLNKSNYYLCNGIFKFKKAKIK